MTSHALLLLGDVNASLLGRHGNSQDVKLKNFCDSNNLHSKQKGQHTFLHVNGRDNADNILFNKKGQRLIRSVRAVKYTDTNTSDHIPVTATLQLRVQEKKTHAVETRVKPIWENRDVQLYSYHIANQLHPFNQPQSDYEFVLSLGHFVSTLKKAVNLSIPGHRDSRKVRPVKDRVWNEEISKSVKDCKDAWCQWRQAGEPVCAAHPLSLSTYEKMQEKLEKGASES